MWLKTTPICRQGDKKTINAASLIDDHFDMMTEKKTIISYVC